MSGERGHAGGLARGGLSESKMVGKITIFVAILAVAIPFLLSLAFDGWVRDYVGDVNFSLGDALCD